MAIFDRTIAAASKFADSSKGLAVNVQEAFSKTFATGKHAGSKVGGVAGSLADRSASYVIKAARLPVSLVSTIYKRTPTLATVGTVAAGATIVSGAMNRRSERKAMEQVNQLEMAQAQQAAMAQAQANTVTPAEYAAMEARMKQGGQNGGFAASIQAERAAAANQSPAV